MNINIQNELNPDQTIEHEPNQVRIKRKRQFVLYVWQVLSSHQANQQPLLEGLSPNPARKIQQRQTTQSVTLFYKTFTRQSVKHYKVIPVGKIKNKRNKK